jgi:hypothetical protein
MAAMMGETPKQKFDRLVDLRVRNVEESIRRFSQLSNVYIYEYQKADVDERFTSIANVLLDAQRRFEDGFRRAERLRQRVGASAPATQSGWEKDVRERIVKKAR